MQKPLIAIIVGSDSDRPVMQKAVDVFNEFDVAFEFRVLSAHRLPDMVAEYARMAELNGLEVLIAGAGMAAHLAGALAANTTLPVIGVPIASGALNGMDALLSTVQMPSGVPVAAVAIDGAKNAAYLALQILGLKYPEITKKLKEYRQASRGALLAVKTTELPGWPAPKRGKVRDIYDLGDKLLFVATDRVSVFDVVLPTPVPDKGRILTQISEFWFKKMEDIIPNHMISLDIKDFPEGLLPFAAMLKGRSMLVKKANPLPVEFIVRGYLSGSAWSEYERTGSVCGIKLPGGLKESSKLPEPLFTASTKAQTGHDQNITFTEMEKILADSKLAKYLKDISISIYNRAHEIAQEKGILIADTKFEYGLLNGEPILIDELLTPDSSRFWPSDEYAPGRSQKSFDKQFVRDYCTSLGWDKNPPGPELPADIVQKTRDKYLEAYKLLTGSMLSLVR